LALTPNVGALLTGIVNPQAPTITTNYGTPQAQTHVANPYQNPVGGYIPGQSPPPAAPTPSPSGPPAEQPTAPQLGGGNNLGGGNLGLVNMFPAVNDSLALEQQGIARGDAGLNEGRQRLVINYGDPALADMAGFGLDPQAGAFARQNYLSGNSTLSRIDKQHHLAAQAIINQLAAHGILNSGDLGYREGQENQGYGNNIYDAQQSVLDQLRQLTQGYLSSREGLHQHVIDAMNAALQAYMQNPDAYAATFGGGNGGTGGTNNGTDNRTDQPPKNPAAAAMKALGGDVVARYVVNHAKRPIFQIP
jgi:hypothetical protein